MGDAKTARCQLAVEGVGVGATFLGGLGLALTGAAGATVGPLAWLSMAGVSLFGAGALAGPYHALATPDGFGMPTSARPLVLVRLGYGYLDDPTFAVTHLTRTAVEIRPGRWELGYEGYTGWGQGYSDHRGWLGWVLAGQAGAGTVSADGSRLDARVAVGSRSYDLKGGDVPGLPTPGWTVHYGELELAGRIDAGRWLPALRGSFVDGALGVALRRTDVRRLSASQSDSVLLGRTAFGFYLGHQPETRGGEIMAFYDHRHDDLVGGMKIVGIGSGAIGHIGLGVHYFLSENWGFEARTEFGSTWLSSVGVRWRTRATPPGTPIPAGSLGASDASAFLPPAPGGAVL